MKADRCVYFHLRPDTNEVFYIGIGRPERARNSSGRNKYWKKIVEICRKPIVLIIANGLTMEQAVEIEKFWIKHHGLHRLANISPGGDGVGGFVHSEETILKIKIASTGKKHSEASKKKMSAVRMGVKISKEHVARLIKLNTGRKRKDDHNLKLFEANRDKTIYEFYHPKHETIICTQYELKQKFDLKDNGISTLKSGKLKTYKKWRIINRSIEQENPLPS
jgi:hypothetical protein